MAKANAEPLLRTETEHEFSSEPNAVDAAIDAWRRRVTNVLIPITAIVHLPGPFFLWFVYGSRLSKLALILYSASYVAVVVAATLHNQDYRKRVWICNVAGYLAVMLGNIAGFTGPYVEVGLVAFPVLALELLGSTAAIWLAITSVMILVLTPFLRSISAVARVVGVDPLFLSEPHKTYWFQAAGITGFLVVLIVILSLFQRLLLKTLIAQFRATSAVKREMRERQILERQLAEAAETERRLLGHELHDGVCQQMTAALLHCQALELRTENGGTAGAQDFQMLSSLLAETIDDAHNIALGLCPVGTSPEALAPALRLLTRRTQELSSIHCELFSSGDVSVADPSVAQQLYRIAQEALSNAVRHAHASRIVVELRGTEAELTLRVEDNGKGIADPHSSGMGLKTMAFRAQVLGGDFAIAARPEGGTCMSCRVPRGKVPPAVSPEQQRGILS